MFNAVDNHNKLALGPGSAQYAVRTMKWERRAFFAVVAQYATNAYLAFKANPNFAYISHQEFKVRLAHALLTEAYIPSRPRRPLQTPVDASGVRMALQDAMAGHVTV